MIMNLEKCKLGSLKEMERIDKMDYLNQTPVKSSEEIEIRNQRLDAKHYLTENGVESLVDISIRNQQLRLDFLWEEIKYDGDNVEDKGTMSENDYPGKKGQIYDDIYIVEVNGLKYEVTHTEEYLGTDEDGNAEFDDSESFIIL